VDAEDQSSAVHGPHELAEGLDDLESPAVAAVRIEGGDRRVRQLVELAALQILPDPLVDARIAALHVEQRPDDVDIEVLVRERGAGDDVVGKREDQPGQTILVKARLPQLLELALRNDL